MAGHIIKLGLMNEGFLGTLKVVIFLYPVYNSSLAALITLSRGLQAQCLSAACYYHLCSALSVCTPHFEREPPN